VFQVGLAGASGEGGALGFHLGPPGLIAGMRPHLQRFSPRPRSSAQLGLLGFYRYVCTSSPSLPEKLPGPVPANAEGDGLYNKAGPDRESGNPDQRERSGRLGPGGSPRPAWLLALGLFIACTRGGQGKGAGLKESPGIGAGGGRCLLQNGGWTPSSPPGLGLACRWYPGPRARVSAAIRPLETLEALGESERGTGKLRIWLWKDSSS
jgi:hypothetical protein